MTSEKLVSFHQSCGANWVFNADSTANTQGREWDIGSQTDAV